MVREEIRKGIERYLKVKYAKKIEDAEEFEICSIPYNNGRNN